MNDDRNGVDISWFKDEDISAVTKGNLVLVVAKNLNVWQQSAFRLLQTGSGLEAAERYLLGEVSHRYENGKLSYEDVAELFNSLTLPQRLVNETFPVHLVASR